MAEFTKAEVDAALAEFLPRTLSPSTSTVGDRNSRELVSQTIAIILHALVVDADGPYYLRSIAAARLLKDVQTISELLQEILEDLHGVVGIDTPPSPSVETVEAAQTALDSLAAHVRSDIVPQVVVSTFAAAMDATMDALSSMAVGTSVATVLDAVGRNLRALRSLTKRLDASAERFAVVEETFRKAQLRPVILAHITSAVGAMLEEVNATLAGGDRDQLLRDARSLMLRVAAARTAITAIANASSTVNQLVDADVDLDATVLEHKVWASGEQGKSTSETAAVLEGSAGRVMALAYKAAGTTGFTTDAEGDTGAGTDPQVELSGFGPFEVTLDPGVLLDVSWQPGSQLSDGTTTVLLDHDGAGNIVAVPPGAVVAGTVDYVTGAIRGLTFNVRFAGGLLNIVYQSKANTRTNVFTDTGADFSAAGVVSGDILELLIGGGPEDPSGDGFADRYRVLSVVGPTQLSVTKDAGSVVSGGIPEPYTDLVYRVLGSVSGNIFGTWDAPSESFMSFKAPTAAGDPTATLPVPWVGRTDAADNMLTGPGAFSSGVPQRAVVFAGTAGWVGSAGGAPSAILNDPDRVLAALPYLHESASSGSLMVQSLFGVEVTAPATARGFYLISEVRSASGADRAGWEYVLEDPIPTYFTNVSNYVLGASDPALLTYRGVLPLGRVEAGSVTGSIAGAGSSYDFVDDGAGAIVPGGASVLGGTIDYLTGAVSVTFTSVPGGAGNVVVSCQTLALTYSVVPLSRVMRVAAAGAPQEVCREVEFAGLSFRTDFAASPTTNPGPGDFLFAGQLRPHWFRIAAFLSETRLLIEPVTYSSGRDVFPLEYVAGATNFRFFRAQPGASTVNDLHDEYEVPNTIPDYRFQNLLWHNTTNIFRSTDYGGAWSAGALAGWERLVLDPLGSPQRVGILGVPSGDALQIDVYLSDQLGTTGAPHDAVEFAMEDVVHPGDWLQVPLESDWPKFVLIDEVLTDGRLKLREGIPAWTSAQFPGGMEFRIVRSTALTAQLDLVDDLGAKSLSDRGPFLADPHGVIASQVRAPADGSSPPKPYPGCIVEVHAGGEVLKSRIARIAASGRQIVLEKAILPPWRRRIPWRILWDTPGNSRFVRRGEVFTTLPEPGDRVCFWGTGVAEVPNEERRDLPLVQDMLVESLLRAPLVEASEALHVIRTDQALPRFAEGYMLVHRGAARLAGRDTLLSRLFSAPTLSGDAFKSLFQVLNELRIQLAQDERLVYDYSAAPSMQVNDVGEVVGVRNSPGPPAEDWTSAGVAVGQLVHLVWSATGYSAVTTKTYVTRVTERDVEVVPRRVPQDSSEGFAAAFTLSNVAFFTNDVTPLLVALGTFLSECTAAEGVLTAYLSGRSPVEEETVAGILKLLDDAGLDRAKELLEEGRVGEFLKLTAEGASYSSQALSGTSVLSSIL